MSSTCEIYTPRLNTIHAKVKKIKNARFNFYAQFYYAKGKDLVSSEHN